VGCIARTSWPLRSIEGEVGLAVLPREEDPTFGQVRVAPERCSGKLKPCLIDRERPKKTDHPMNNNV
jgi:hypothetical protein